MRRSLIACGALLWAATLLHAGQKPQIPSLGETVEVELTNLDVVITGSDGAHVHGLTKDDFEILQDGVRQPITHFAEYTLAAKGEKEGPREPRSLLLFIEIVRLPSFRVDPFVAALKEVVRTTITSPEDRVAVIAFTGRAEMRAAPTNDVAAIERALDAIGEEFGGVRHNDIGAVREQMGLLRKFDREGREMASIAKIDRGETPVRTMTASAATLPVLQAEIEMKRRIAAATASVHALAGIEGRRILVLATHRLGQLIGAEYVLASGGSGNAVDNRQEVAKLIANANASGVTIYPLYPAGLDQTSADATGTDIGSAILMNEMASLNTIAERTGGATAYGTTGIVRLLPQIAADVANYYSLAYRATDDEPHEIVVRAKNPDLAVRARRQVIERTDAGRMRDRLLAVMYEAWLYSPLTVSATLGESKQKAKKRNVVPLRVTVPIGELTLLPVKEGTHAGAFTVFLMSGAAYGETSAVVEETRRIEMPSEKLSSYRGGNLTYEVELHVESEADRVAVGVLDEVSKNYGLTVVPLPR